MDFNWWKKISWREIWVKNFFWIIKRIILKSELLTKKNWKFQWRIRRLFQPQREKCHIFWKLKCKKFDTIFSCSSSIRYAHNMHINPAPIESLEPKLTANMWVAYATRHLPRSVSKIIKFSAKICWFSRIFSVLNQIFHIFRCKISLQTQHWAYLTVSNHALLLI